MSDIAARQTFVEIADTIEDNPELGQVLSLTDNLPLAISLIANLAAFEGCTSVLERWKTETTLLLSDGHDRKSSLDKSIMISLTCARMRANPDAHLLLSLLSILPDGLSESAMVEIQLPFNMLESKLTLLRTSLAYITHGGYLKILMPICDYIQSRAPPAASIIHSVQDYFYSLANISEDLDNGLLYTQQNSYGYHTQQIAKELGNIYSLINLNLKETGSDFKATIKCVLNLVKMTDLGIFGPLGATDLLQTIKAVAENTNDRGLYAEYLYYLAFTKESLSEREALCLEANVGFQFAHNHYGQGV